LGKIGAGQSFFIESTATGVATFKNSMRVGSQSQGNSQFFKSATQGITPAETSTCVTEDRHRLWLHLRNLTAAPQQFKQTLVGYSPLATTSATLDRNYDAKTLVAEPYTINFYSLSPGGEKLTIQGRSLNTSFNVNDVIPLGYNCKLYGSVSNTIQLGISEEDGLFDNQEVYLRINTSGVYSYHNLKAAPYTFTITASMPTDDTTTFAIVFKTPVTTQLNTAYCGKTNIPLNQYIAATGVTGFQGFQWLFIRQSDGAQAIVTTTTTTTTAVFLNNANFPAGYIRYNESYVVRVSVLVAGVWSAYGKPCSITTTSLISSIKTPACNTVLASLNTTITAQSVTTYTTPATIVPTGYHWEVTNLNTSEVRTFDTTTTSFNFNNPALTTPSGFVLTSSPYCIRVRPYQLF
jgi:hypothetical protein